MQAAPSLTAEQQQLLTDHIRLANHLAGRAAAKNPFLDYEDAQAAAWQGLWMAVIRFDVAKKVKFATYATTRISGQITDYLRDFNGRHGQKDATNLVRLDRTLFDTNPVYGADDRERNSYSLIPQRDTTADRMHVEDFWRIALKGMDKRQRLMMVMYHRIGCTMKQIGADLGVSESRISQQMATLNDQLRANLIRNESKVI